MEELKKNIPKYYLFSFFIQFAVFAPIAVLFWQGAGLSMFDIMVLGAIYSFVSALLEIPTGTFADRFGDKLSLSLGALFLSMASLYYFFSYNFYQFLVAELIWALARSLLSGADTAFLYNTLEGFNKKNLFKKINGNAKFGITVGAGFATLMSGFIAVYSLRVTFLISSIAFFISFIATLFMKEPKHYKKVIKSNYLTILKETYTFVKKHKLVRWYIIYLAALSSFNGLFWVYYQPYFQYVGLSLVFFGVAFTFYNFFSATISKYGHKIHSYFGEEKLLFVMPLFLIIPLMLMPFITSLIGLGLIFFHQFNRAICKTILPESILKFTFENKRATVLSIMSLLSSLIRAVFMPIFGYIYDIYNIFSFVHFGLFFIVVFSVLGIMYTRIPKKYFKVKK